MYIDFENIEEQTKPHFKGGEKEAHLKIFDDSHVKIMKGWLPPGGSLGEHTHDTSCEIIFVTKGNGKVRYDGGEEALRAGSCHYCPKGHTHQLINNGDENLYFTAVVPEQ